MQKLRQKYDAQAVEDLMKERDRVFYSIKKFKRPTYSKPKPTLPKYLLPILPFDVGPNNLFRTFKVMSDFKNFSFL